MMTTGNLLSMRLTALACLAAWSGVVPSLRAMPAGEPAADRCGGECLLVKASVVTAGPYGDSWDLSLWPDGEASLSVFYGRPSGRLLGLFTFSEERMGALKKALASTEFFSLPASISPPSSPLHQPDLYLEVTLAGRYHKVNLYDPDTIKGRAEAKRFLALWTEVFQELPLKPSW